MAVTYSSFVTPTGNVAPAVRGTSFNAPFSGTATFTGPSCAQGVYRQYVKGSFKANGSVVAHVLCGSTTLSSSVFTEDGCPPPGCTAYGYRACANTPMSSYSPNAATGCSFSMSDAPGFGNIRSGVAYAIDLTFRGTLYDSATMQGLVTNSWTVNGAYTVPQLAAPEVSIGASAEPRFVAARLSRNLSTGETELHVVATRPKDQPPLDATRLEVQARDASDARLSLGGEPDVHEVLGRHRSTATLVYRLAHDAGRPTRLTIRSGGGRTILDVPPQRDRSL